MKNNKVLPLVALISGLLVGCGGGGGGGGGGAPVTNYTFTFVTPVEKNASQSGSCTIYKRFEDNGVSKVLNYHEVSNFLDNKIIGFYSDENGGQVGSLINASNGKILFQLESVPDNGSFTVQEANGTVINAITYSKSVLASDNQLQKAYLSVQQPVAGTNCLTGNNEAETIKSGLAYLNASDATGNPYTTYYYDSQIETVTDTNPQLTSGKTLTANTGEITMVSQYLTSDRSELFQYGFENWTDSQMVFAGNSASPSIGASDINFTEISIDIIYRAFKYNIATIVTGSDFKHPNALGNGDVWTFNVKGSLDTLGWSASYHDLISENWELNVNDSSLFALTNTNNAKPTVANQVIDLTASLGLGDENGFQRISYQQGTIVGTTPYVLRHSLYSDINAAVKVPNLNYDSVPLDARSGLVISDSSNITQSYLFLSENSDISSSEFMVEYRNGDGIDTTKDVVGVIYGLPEIRTIDNHRSQSKSLYLTRDN